MRDNHPRPLATRIGFFGESMLEISGSPLQKKFGGDTLNTAIYLSRLWRLDKQRGRQKDLCLDINYITAVGDDSLSHQLLGEWRQEGLQTQWVITIPGKKPGLYLIENTDDGERVFHYWRDDSAAKYYFRNSPTPLEMALQARVLDILYISGSSLAILNAEHRRHFIELLRAFHTAGGRLVFDNNYRRQLWPACAAREAYLDILPMTDIAFLTDADERQVFGGNDPDAIIRRCLELGVKETVIKRGGNSCVVQAGEEMVTVPVHHVSSVVDTCAAGDSFAAGYLFERLSGGGVLDAARAGHKLAATVIQYSGAIIPMEVMG